MIRTLQLTFLCLFLSLSGFAQTEHSVARKWNELVLEAIRRDLARPTIQARNLFQISAAMYDAWAVFTPEASPYYLGQEVGGFPIPFEGFTYDPVEKESLLHEAISYASYRMIEHRFRNSPKFSETRVLIDGLMSELGYDINFFDTNYTTGSAAALGNYIADRVKACGFEDGANELGSYSNIYYEPVNEPLPLISGGENFMDDPNRWQPLLFDEPFVDQNGNEIQAGSIPFLSPEWGNVVPFSFSGEDLDTYTRDDKPYIVFADPGHPPFIDSISGASIEDPYKWGFSLVSIWASHLDPTDEVMIDISPNTIGNIPIDNYPEGFEDYVDFYDLLEGGDISQGYSINPRTGNPYEEQIVPRGDYARVLAEFWADGPSSETPPGHWFSILHYVSDQPDLIKKFQGEGEVLNSLEWDIKSYFVLGGAMHDAALAAWSIKGYYDYVRPISAIRYMATCGQSSDPEKPGYSKSGIPLVPGKIELIEEGDELAGAEGEYINKIKLYTWRAHDFIDNAETDVAGVGWIRAEDWWPYQRPSFVTPPFAGYISGHSTFSRTAAEVLALFTGDEYFPGGLGEFVAEQDNFLVFEKGPSVDVVLQWARYVDASDQCSLSRIWGGIHPPADDIPGRKIGMVLGPKAFHFARSYFTANALGVAKSNLPIFQLFPNPASDILHLTGVPGEQEVVLRDTNGKLIFVERYNQEGISLHGLPSGLYLVTVGERTQKLLIE